MNIDSIDADDIYFSKTREYFQEVLSSYACKNYRSATVMLYSITICDILFKLQELKDMYNDKKAAEILKEVNKCRNENNNGSKSRWEKELIDKVYRETQLLDNQSYMNLNHLFDDRNISAHPAMNENYELLSPSKETTMANIKNVFAGILVKPPIFIKNVIDMLTEDLKSKKDIYSGKDSDLKTYLNNKYFIRMSDSMKIATFKTFWKLCFILSDDEECRNNVIINRKALVVLTEDLAEKSILLVKNDSKTFLVSDDRLFVQSLIIFLAIFPKIYNVLNQDVKIHLDNLIEEENLSKAISWFKHKDMTQHIEWLRGFPKLEIDSDTIKFMTNMYDESGCFDQLLDFFITYYGNSKNYDAADNRFALTIEPFLNRMKHDDFIKLIEVTHTNSQIYDRRNSSDANNTILKYAKKYLGEDFNFDEYYNFNYSKPLYKQLNESVEKTETTDEEIPF